MQLSRHPYIVSCIIFVMAAVIAVFSTKRILAITRKKKLFDVPDHVRKIHGSEIPSLGGTGIFIACSIVLLLFIEATGFQYIILANLLLFFTGIYDDIMDMSPMSKLAMQLTSCFVSVFAGKLLLPVTLPGITDISLQFAVSALTTTLLGTFFINVFNFIDGIDGLACMTAIFCAGVFGALLALGHQFTGSYWAFGIAGAAAGLLVYNYSPARLYLGDTGSMVLGFNLFGIAMYFINTADTTEGASSVFVHMPRNSITIAVSLLFLPAFDALRVFTMRLTRGISPMRADRRHLHHYLLDCGFSHAQAAWLILLTMVITSLTGFLLQDVHPLLLVAAIAAPSIILTFVCTLLRRTFSRAAV